MLYDWTFWVTWCEVLKLKTCIAVVNLKLSIFLETLNWLNAHTCWIWFAGLTNLKNIRIDWFRACQVLISYLYV